MNRETPDVTSWLRGLADAADELETHDPRAQLERVVEALERRRARRFAWAIGVAVTVAAAVAVFSVVRSSHVESSTRDDFAAAAWNERSRGSGESFVHRAKPPASGELPADGVSSDTPRADGVSPEAFRVDGVSSDALRADGVSPDAPADEPGHPDAPRVEVREEESAVASAVRPTDPASHRKRGRTRTVGSSKPTHEFPGKETSSAVPTETAPTVDELFRIVRQARADRDVELARATLMEIRTRFADEPAAEQATFLLGRVESELGTRPDQAMRWFAAYVREFPNGQFVGQARGRLMVALKQHDIREAQRIAREYLEQHPSGAYADFARDLLRSDEATPQ